MINDVKFSKVGCLVDEDFYLYISGEGSTEKLGSMEIHLTRCPDCRSHLAALLEILHPNAERAEEEMPAPSKAELDRTVAIIAEISRKERAKIKHPSPRFQRPIAAAAAIAFIALSFWGLKSLYETKKSRMYFSQAEAILNQSYEDASPSNLRLDLPFHSVATYRGGSNPESFRQAENLFFQALAFRESMIDAHLGLACIYLKESKPARARDEFQKVLVIRKEHLQALIGRGVAQYEEVIQGADPLGRRTLLEGALGDFSAALKLAPNSPEALYNKIWALYESGLHKEALQLIERYFSEDSSSIWAEKLKSLKVKMRATQISAVEDDVRGYARDRNQAALLELARQAPYQMPAAIMSAMKQSLDLEQAAPGGPNSEDLRWAASTMESAYRESTGDAGFKALPAFYVGLSPPQRAQKRALDKKLQDLDKLYSKSQFAAILSASSLLLSQYTDLQDFWQVADIHHLRGNSYYLGKANFKAAEAEFRTMLDVAGRLNAVALEAKAMGSLALIYGMQRKFDDGLYYANGLKNLAQSHNLKSWEIYAHMALGFQFRYMGQFERSLQEYAAAMGTAYQLLDGLYVIEVLENLGIAMDRLGHIQEAKAFYRLALQQQDDFLANRIMEPMPELTITRLNLLFRQGEIALRCGDVTSAEALFQESLKSTPPGMHELEGRNRLGLAEIYFRTNRFPEAEKMMESVMTINASGNYPEIEWQTRSLGGRLLERADRREEALASLRKAIDVLERMRLHINQENLRQSFFADRFNPFKTMVSLLNRSVGNRRGALEFVDRAKSMTLREYLRLPELDLGSQDTSAGVSRNISVYPSVEYFFADDELLIFFVRGEQIEVVSQNLPKEKLALQIQEYLASIKIKDKNNFSRLARMLYDELITPIEKQIFADASDALIILPDGPLHLLPFAGLQDRLGCFLIEKTPIAFAPSRSVLRHCLVSDNKKASGDFIAMLIDGSANLPSAQQELASLSQLCGRNASILTPRDMPIFKQKISASEIVHFSGHAVDVQGRPALMMRASPNEIYLDCQAIGACKMPRAYLVNLAGCSTGTGPLSEGESPWGLIPAFLNAGAPAIIASLMPVDDASTERLNCRFYELLRKGVGKAEALQKAQITLLDSARSDSNSNPQLWMPYILVGNPR
jgi:CHAT domain-containing protein